MQQFSFGILKVAFHYLLVTSFTDKRLNANRSHFLLGNLFLFSGSLLCPCLFILDILKFREDEMFFLTHPVKHLVDPLDMQAYDVFSSGESSVFPSLFLSFCVLCILLWLFPLQHLYQCCSFMIFLSLPCLCFPALFWKIASTTSLSPLLSYLSQLLLYISGNAF